MIRTREEIALVTSPCAQHTRPLQQDVVSGCTHQERRMDQDLSRYRCLPPFIENCKAHDCLLWDQQALASQVGTRTCSHVGGMRSAWG